MSIKLEQVATVVVTLAAIMVAATLVRREFRPARAEMPSNLAAPSRVSNWEELVSSGHRVGDANARVIIVEFADFECPFCRRFSESLAEAQRTAGSDLAYVFVHYPLANHRFARPAARVAECAATMGRFSEMHTLLFQKQDSLGLKSWVSFARDAGITDTLGFYQCATDTTRLPLVETGLRVGSALGVHATPTVIINGLRYATPPYDSLGEIVRRLLAEK